MGNNCGSSSSPPSGAARRLVIIGGGYAGQAVSKLADTDFDITVIDPREVLLHKIGGVRACVRKEWIDPIMIPQDKVLTRGHRVRGSVKEVKFGAKQVILADGSIIPYDYLVIASGARSLSPAEPNIPNTKEFFNDIADKVQVAENICIIGGGPVGCELVGEILGKYPQKGVTLVHSGSKLCDNVRANPAPEFHQSIKEKLEGKKVQIILNKKAKINIAEFSEKAYLVGKREVFLEGGAEKTEVLKDVDLLFFCGGFVPNTNFLPKNILDERQLIKVNEYLQVEGQANVFAVGDCTNVDETKTYVVSVSQKGKAEGWPRGHADVVYDNLVASMKKSPQLFAYVPNHQWFGMILPLGPTDSVVAGYPIEYGQYKSANYFIGNQWEAAHLPTPTFPAL